MRIELWHLVSMAIAFVTFCGVGGRVLLGLLQRDLDSRFKAVTQRLEGIEARTRDESAQWQRIERELLHLKAELPLHYVMREDYVRGQSIVEAKLDGLADKLEKAQLRGIINGRPHDH